MSWYDDKELSLGVDVIGWNSIQKEKLQFKKKKKLSYTYIYIYIYKEKTKQKLVVCMLKKRDGRGT